MTEEDAINPHKRTGMGRVFYAIGHSIRGIGSALKFESAFRQELLLACLLVPVAIFLPVGVMGSLLLIMSLFIVLITELLNSAVEWVVDYISLDIHSYAKRSKDMASAAVFCSLLQAAIVWGTLVVVNWSAITERVGSVFGG